jgi:hypothetical protein
LKECDISLETEKERNIYAPLPWDHINLGVDRRFLLRRMKDAKRLGG